jgi:hypothetical protein
MTTAMVLMALALAAVSPARAQDVPLRQYNLLVVGGFTKFDESSGLLNDVYGGVEANYNLTTHLAIGGFMLASRPTTDRTMFPLVRMAFIDTVLHYLVSQQVTLLEFGLQGVARLPVGRFTLLGNAGTGLYLIDLDPQRADKPGIPGEQVKRMTGRSYLVGGGVSMALGRTGGVRLQVRDFIYTGYDREVLSLSEPLLAAENIPHPRSDVPEPRSTIHSLRYELSFSFNPRGGS